jgi:hypothetical protein
MSLRKNPDFRWKCLMTTVALVLMSASSFAQQPPAKPVTDAPVKVTVIKGLPSVKDNTQGSLIIGDGGLHFSHQAQMTDLSGHSIEDVVTGDDSQRVIRGTVGTLSWFAPYGAGRFLSLFRTKLDTVTIKYRDSDGGLHGAIFTMPVGQAEAIKKELLAQGARTTVTDADTKSAATPSAATSATTEAKEKQ